MATPIGNLEDVSLRALRVLREATLIACEDTRVTRKLLERHDIATPLLSCHAHNERSRLERLGQVLAAGGSVALVSDAGTPLVSDPGAQVLERALALGAPVVAVPGPSAVLAALMTSGLPAERFCFLGFPPRQGRERRAFLDEVLGCRSSAVLFEAPHRIGRTLRELAEREPGRRGSLHREMTKLHEEVRRGSLAELSASLAPARGEYVLVVEGRGTETREGSLEDALALAVSLREQGLGARDAARRAAGEHGVSRRLVYRALSRPRGSPDQALGAGHEGAGGEEE